MDLPIQNLTYQPLAPMLDPLDKPKDSPSVLSPHLFFTPNLDDEDAQRPSLMSPPPDADRKNAIDWLRQQSDDEGDNGVNGKGKGKDKDETPGSGSNGLLSDAALIMSGILAYYQLTYDNSVKIRNTMAKVNAQAVMAAANATRSQGEAAFWGSFSSAAATLGLTGMGAVQSLKGLSGERAALKSQAATPDVPLPPTPQGTPEVPSVPNALDGAAGQSPVSRRNSIDADALDDAASPPRTPEANQSDVPDAPPPVTNPDTDAATGPSPLNQDDLAAKARRSQTVGQAMTMLSNPVAGLANGVGRFSEMNAARDQKVTDSASQLAKDGMNTMQEQSNRDTSTINEMLRAFDSISQASISAVTTIAGNLRA